MQAVYQGNKNDTHNRITLILKKKVQFILNMQNVDFEREVSLNQNTIAFCERMQFALKEITDLQ